MTTVLRHVISAIGPASAAHAEAARAHVAAAGAPVLERIASILGGAQHTPRPRSARRAIIVVAGDHGCADPGIAMGADHPTVIIAHAIAAGTAALAHVARTSHTPILLVDAGVREPTHLPAIAIAVGHAPSRDLTREPALTDATALLEAGIALAVGTLSPLTTSPPTDDPQVARITAKAAPDLGTLSPFAGGLADVLALGAIGLGAEVASAALLGAITGRSPVGLGDPMAEAAGARGAAMAGADPIDLLATFGGPETAVLAGLILGAASMNVPVILDGYATGAAALVAVLLASDVTGYLVAAHRGTFTHPAIVDQLGLRAVFDVGLGHGEGTGAAMVLPLIDQVAAIAAQS